MYSGNWKLEKKSFERHQNNYLPGVRPPPPEQNVQQRMQFFHMLPRNKASIFLNFQNIVNSLNRTNYIRDWFIDNYLHILYVQYKYGF